MFGMGKAKSTDAAAMGHKPPDVSNVLHKPFTTVDEYVNFWSAMDTDGEATKFFALLAQRLLSHEKERGKHSQQSYDSSGAPRPPLLRAEGPRRPRSAQLPPSQPPHRARQLARPSGAARALRRRDKRFGADDAAAAGAVFPH